jgi:hypothetical protein
MAQFPPVVNCNANGGAPACPTGKKAFPTSAAAESFASELQRKNPTAVRQSAYACEECPHWHLSAMTADAYSMAQSRSGFSEKYGRVPGLGLKYAHLQTKIKEAYLADVKENGQHGAVMRVARKFEVEYSLVRIFLIETGLHKTSQARSDAGRRAWQNVQKANAAPTVESLSSEEEQVKAQLAALQAKKQALIDAKALKVSDTIDKNGVIIRKEGYTLVLAYDDAFELVDRLTAHLGALPKGIVQ